MLLLCNHCVKSFQAGGFNTYFCPGCNSQCEELPANSPPPAEKPRQAPPPPVPQEKTLKIPEPKPAPKVTPPPPKKPVPVPEKASTILIEPEEEASAGRKEDLKPMNTSEINLASLTPLVIQKTAAVSAEIKTPSPLIFLKDFLFKPGNVLATAESCLSKSVPAKFKFFFLIFTLTLLTIGAKLFLDQAFLFDSFTVLSELFLFSFVLTLGLSFLTELESALLTGITLATFDSAILLLHNLVLAAFSFFSLKSALLPAGFFFLLAKIFLFGRLASKSSGTGLGTGILLSSISSLTVAWSFSILYRFIYA